MSAWCLDRVQEVTLGLAHNYLTNTVSPLTQCVCNILFLTFYMPHLKFALTEEGQPSRLSDV